MAPYYEYVCNELQLPVDQGLLAKMKETNKTEVDKLEEAVKDAEENLGEIEIRDAKIAKAEFLSKIGDKVTICTENKAHVILNCRCYCSFASLRMS